MDELDQRQWPDFSEPWMISVSGSPDDDPADVADRAKGLWHTGFKWSDSYIGAIDRISLKKFLAANRGRIMGEPEAEPLFPVAGKFIPDCECPHAGPIDEDSAFVCMTCHDAGKNARPGRRKPDNARPGKAPWKTRDDCEYVPLDRCRDCRNHYSKKHGCQCKVFPRKPV